MYGRILKNFNIVDLYRGMSKLKFKMNVNLPQLLCIVVSVALNGELVPFGRFCVNRTLLYVISVSFLNELNVRMNNNSSQRELGPRVVQLGF